MLNRHGNEIVRLEFLELTYLMTMQAERTGCVVRVCTETAKVTTIQGETLDEWSETLPYILLRCWH